MAYLCELGTGQRIYLDNRGTQTVVTTLMSSPGQQQQSSNSFQTGNWTSPPEMFQTPHGVFIKINTAQGEHYIQIQGNSMTAMSGTPSFSGGQQVQVQQVSQIPASPVPPMQPMQPMQPMPPMQPMAMGDMQMNVNPMEMRLGNMEMRMGSPPSQGVRHFCSQCGAPVKEGDRFCSSCGHRLI